MRSTICMAGQWVNHYLMPIFDESTYKILNFTTIALDSATGYILEVNVEYSQHLHDAHIDLLFCPMREKLPGKRDDKLLATLCDKQRYIIYYRNLQCTRHGLRTIKDYHCILQFAQSLWLRDYIELNTKFRFLVKNFGQRYWKKIYTKL